MQTNEIIDGILDKMHESRINARQMADASGVPKSTVDRILRKETANPSLQNILDMAAAVGYQIGAPIPKPPAVGDPDQYFEYINKVHADQVARMRAHYNMLLAAKDRWINYLFLLCLGLVVFNIVVLLVV